MNRRDAKKATDEFRGTVGDVREMIDARRGDTGASRVSGFVRLQGALDACAAGFAGRPDDDEIVIWRPDPYSTSGRKKRTLDSMIVQNVIRECL